MKEEKGERKSTEHLPVARKFSLSFLRSSQLTSRMGMEVCLGPEEW